MSSNTWDELYMLSTKRVSRFWGHTKQSYWVIFATVSDIYFWIHKVNSEIIQPKFPGWVCV